jgi:hypothetical protein
MGVKRIKIPKHKKVETHCNKFGKDLYYRVDGNNGAISHNAKGICKNTLCKDKI